MTAISWAFGVSGDWSNGVYWTGGAAPGVGDDVTIAAIGTYTVTVSSADAANSLLLNDAGATVALNSGGALTIGAALDVTAGVIQLNYGSKLSIGSSLDVAGGTVQLASGGVISGGTLSANGGAFVWNGGTLSGVTYAGDLTLGASAFLAIGSGGLTVEGAGGPGSGLVNVTGAGAILDFAATQTFGGATIDLGSATPSPRYGHGTELIAAGGATLTLGSGVQIDQTAKYCDINGQGVIINQGTIDANYAGGVMLVGVYYAFPNKIKLQDFNNQGSVDIDNGVYFGIESQHVENKGVILVNNHSELYMHDTYLYESGPGKEQIITNYGTVTASNYSTFVFDDSFSTFKNLGTISAQSGSTINLTGNFSNYGEIIATEAKVVLNGNLIQPNVSITKSSVELWFGALGTASLERLNGKKDAITLYESTLQNGGTVVAVGPGSGLGTLTLTSGAMIDGGTVADAGGGIVFKDGGLTNVVYQGEVDLSGASSYLDVGAGGIVLTGAGGRGPGVIDLTSQTGTISFAAGYESLDNATVELGGGHAVIYQKYSRGRSGELSLGANLTIVQTGSYGEIGGSAVVNQGTIDVGAAGAQFDITTSFFWNKGLIDVEGGGALETRSLYNQSGTILSGGTLEVDAGSTLTLDTSDHSGPVVDAAVIIMSGDGSVFQTLDGSGVAHSLESSLATIAAGGVLDILAGRDWSSATTMTNAGILELGGGTFAPGGLTSTGVMTGYGVIATTLGNTGVIEIDAGQTLSLVGGDLANLTGTTLTGGVFIVGVGSTWQLANDTSIATLDATVVLDGNGSTLQAYDTATGSEVGIKASLATIGASGALELLDGRNFAAGNAVTNLGVLELAGGTFSGDALSDAAGSTLTGFGTVVSAFADAGAVTAACGALAFSGAGDVFGGALAGTEIDFTSGTDLLAAGSSLAASTVALSGGATVSLAQSLAFGGALNVGSAALTLAAGVTLSLAGATTLAAGATVGGARTASLALSGSLTGTAGSGEAVVAVKVTDGGLIEAASGTLDLSQALTGSGGLKIDAGATLEADGAAAKTLTATFAGTGATLALGAAAKFAALIAGFASGETIDLIDTAATGATLGAGGKLVITNGSQTVATLHLKNARHETFTVTSDGHGGSDVTVTAGAAPPSLPAFSASIAAMGADAGAAAASLVTATTPASARLASPVRG